MSRPQAPTLINLPPPSDHMTPLDAPGTPNSATTTMSELSTVAIKDGHRGHLPHHQHPLEAERADRISRLAGLERITARPSSNLSNAQTPPAAYFDQNAQPQIMRERSTVGSASATGSVGGRTTWASGSNAGDYDPDKMSEDQDMETSSTGGFSDEAASLVGFGEGARTPARQHSTYGSIGSPVVGKASASAVPPYLRDQGAGTPMTGVSTASTAGSVHSSTSTEAARRDARMTDGMAYDPSVTDASNRTPPHVNEVDDAGVAARSGMSGVETAEGIIRDRIEKGTRDGY